MSHLFLFESLSSRIDGLDPGGGYSKKFLSAFFSKGQLSEREEIPFLTGIWFSSPLFSLFLNPLVFLDSGFVFLPGGFFPGGVLFSLPELPPILGGILSDGGGSGF